YRRALAARERYAQAHYNLGIALKALNQHDEAIACFQQAAAIIPDFANAHWNESLTRLGAGDFTGGWQKYEWRWKRGASQKNKRDFAQPTWLGRASVAGKTVLLHAEQGIGDTIQFCRYVPLVAGLGAKVVIEVQRPIQRLIASLAGAPSVIARGDP